MFQETDLTVFSDEEINQFCDSMCNAHLAFDSNCNETAQYALLVGEANKRYHEKRVIWAKEQYLTVLQADMKVSLISNIALYERLGARIFPNYDLCLSQWREELEAIEAIQRINAKLEAAINMPSVYTIVYDSEVRLVGGEIIPTDLRDWLDRCIGLGWNVSRLDEFGKRYSLSAGRRFVLISRV